MEVLVGGSYMVCMAAEEQDYIIKWDFQRKQTDGGLPIFTLDVAQKLWERFYISLQSVVI